MEQGSLDASLTNPFAHFRIPVEIHDILLVTAPERGSGLYYSFFRAQAIVERLLKDFWIQRLGKLGQFRKIFGFGGFANQVFFVHPAFFYGRIESDQRMVDGQSFFVAEIETGPVSEYLPSGFLADEIPLEVNADLMVQYGLDFRIIYLRMWRNRYERAIGTKFHGNPGNGGTIKYYRYLVESVRCQV